MQPEVCVDDVITSAFELLSDRGAGGQLSILLNQEKKESNPYATQTFALTVSKSCVISCRSYDWEIYVLGCSC